MSHQSVESAEIPIGEYDSETAGVDEAGRGPIAGPVVAAAVLLPTDFDLTGITDSKKMTATAREKAFLRLTTEAQFGIGIVPADEIDRMNILRATHHAMRLALSALPHAPQRVLVDGLPVPHLHENCIAIVQGDLLCPVIAAASIIAKVTRDRLMCEYHTTYPEYGFDQHKGYGTKAHLFALSEHGPCPLHRRTFAPVAQLAFRFEESH
jgi:ribonuclease HII